MGKKKTQKTREAQKGKKIEELNAYDKLPEYQQIAVDMRAYLYSYRVIAKTLKKLGQTDKENTIRRWFCKGYACAKALEWKKRILLEDVKKDLKDIDHIIDLGQPIAAASLVAKAEKGDFPSIELLLALRGRSKVTKVEDVSRKTTQEEKLLEIINQLSKDAKSTIDKTGPDAPTLV